MRIHDISLPIRSDMPTWPGDPPVRVVRQGDQAGGSAPSMPAVSQLELGSHAGTHVDPPAHFIPNGATVDQMALEVLMGPAWLVRLPGPGPITRAALAAASVPPHTRRLLIRTRDDEAVAFDRDYVALAPDAAAWLLEQEIRLIGIDSPSIEPFVSPDNLVHQRLLRAGVVIVEGLALSQVTPGAYELICLPLRIAGGDGAPARAILIKHSDGD